MVYFVPLRSLAIAGPARNFALTDAQLLTLCARLTGVARSMGCGDHSEDLVQSALVVLLRDYPLVTDPVECMNLSVTITRNNILNWRRLRHRGDVELDEIHQPRSRTNLEKDFLEKEDQAFFNKELLSAIKGLGDRCKMLLCFRLRGLSSSDIATRMEISRSAVDVAYFRCLQSLKQRIGVKHAK
jgi:RNA polymerase sigma factor (sigma-70 family)